MNMVENYDAIKVVSEWYLLCTFIALLITTVVWMWIISIMWIAFCMDFVLRLCECGFCRCGLVFYVGLLFTRAEAMLWV